MSHITAPELSHTPRSGTSIEDEKDIGEKRHANVTVQEVNNWTIAEGDYTEAEYKKLVTKIDRCEYIPAFSDHRLCKRSLWAFVRPAFLRSTLLRWC